MSLWRIECSYCGRRKTSITQSSNSLSLCPWCCTKVTPEPLPIYPLAHGCSRDWRLWGSRSARQETPTVTFKLHDTAAVCSNLGQSFPMISWSVTTENSLFITLSFKADNDQEFRNCQIVFTKSSYPQCAHLINPLMMILTLWELIRCMKSVMTILKSYGSRIPLHMDIF